MTEELRTAGYEVVSGPRTTGDGYYESCIVAKTVTTVLSTVAVLLIITFQEFHPHFIQNIEAKDENAAAGCAERILIHGVEVSDRTYNQDT